MRSWAIPLSTVRDNVLRQLLETNGASTTYQAYTEAQFMDVARERFNRFLLETGFNPSAAIVSVTLPAGTLTLPSDFSRLRAAWLLPNGPTRAVHLPVVGWYEYDNCSFINGAFYLIMQGNATSDTAIVFPTTFLADVTNVLFVYDACVPWAAAAVVSDVATLPVPYVFLWGIQWGIIADLLQAEGQLFDDERRAYAEGRWDEAVALAKTWMGEDEVPPEAAS
jgi:hypothetical protein